MRGGKAVAAKKSRKPNWEKIATEYITGDIGQKKLAQKHGIPLRTLQDRCKAESWVAQKRTHRGATVAMACELIAQEQARDTAALITQSAERLLDAANAAIGQLQTPVTAWKCEEETDTGKVTREYVTLDPGSTGAVDPRALRHVAGALRDIAQILSLRPQLDQQEQEARIAKLRADAEARKGDDGDGSEVVVNFDAGPEEWNG